MTSHGVQLASARVEANTLASLNRECLPIIARKTGDATQSVLEFIWNRAIPLSVGMTRITSPSGSITAAGEGPDMELRVLALVVGRLAPTVTAISILGSIMKG